MNRTRTNVVLAVALAVALVALASERAAGFYVPGVHPVNFLDGDAVQPRVGRVSSVRKHVPYDYYDLPACQPKNGIKNFDANLGEVLSGDIFHNSPYSFGMRRNETCAVLCKLTLDSKSEEYETLTKVADTQPSYRVQVRIDNMPAIMMAREVDERTGGESLMAIGKGYPLTTMYEVPGQGGDKEQNIVYGLTNHVNFFIMYHTVDSQILSSPTFGPGPSLVHRIIRVYVTSKSIDYSRLGGAAGELDCNYSKNDMPVIVGDGVEVTFTYRYDIMEGIAF